MLKRVVTSAALAAMLFGLQSGSYAFDLREGEPQYEDAPIALKQYLEGNTPAAAVAAAGAPRSETAKGGNVEHAFPPSEGELEWMAAPSSFKEYFGNR